MPSDKGAETKGTEPVQKTTTKRKAVKKTADEKVAAKKAAKKATAKKKATAATAKRIRVRQMRSGIGSSRTIRRTLTALGLKHHQDEVALPDNPSVRGMVNKVRHLVSVTSEES